MTNEKLFEFVNSHDHFLNRRYYNPFTQNELIGFLGLLVETGTLRLFREPLDNIYCDDPNKSRPIFKATMPRDRFKVLLRILRFDDATTRNLRQKNDKLAPIRYVIETIRSNFFLAYSPSQWVTVDEHLCRYRGRCSFKQFIPSKPDRYGIKVYVLADSSNYFPINFEVYCGKQEVSNKPDDLVARLSSILKPGHIICGDNYFTSLFLSRSLVINSEIYYLGTMRKCRREIPNSVKDIKGLPLYSSRLFYSEETKTSLLSYVTKKNKSVLLLSNIHSKLIIPNDSKKSKPTIILDYNSHKAGVDKLDQMLKEFRMYRANRRWPAVLFFDFVGFVCHASWVIFCLKFPNDTIVKSSNRREFLYNLGKELVAPLIEERKLSPQYKYFSESLKNIIHHSNIFPPSTDSVTPLNPTSSVELNTSVIPTGSIEPNTSLIPTSSIELNTSVIPTGSIEPNTSLIPTSSIELNTSIIYTRSSEPNTSLIPTSSIELNTSIIPTGSIESNTSLIPTSSRVIQNISLTTSLG